MLAYQIIWRISSRVKTVIGRGGRRRGRRRRVTSGHITDRLVIHVARAAVIATDHVAIAAIAHHRVVLFIISVSRGYLMIVSVSCRIIGRSDCKIVVIRRGASQISVPRQLLIAVVLKLLIEQRQLLIQLITLKTRRG